MANRSWCDLSRNSFKSGLRNRGAGGGDFSLLCDRAKVHCPVYLPCCLLAALTGHINETKSSECQEYSMPPFCIWPSYLANEFWAWNKDTQAIRLFHICIFLIRHLFRKYLHVPCIHWAHRESIPRLYLNDSSSLAMNSSGTRAHYAAQICSTDILKEMQSYPYGA